ncbi:MAG: hypothetical protein PHE68_03610 [Candidatus Peribacteraceae bacterium]|nr:hypothetical protein [Candidatus Peribacteraceae bacterium]MDD5074692.1 hypothetical protein [Candidatus Peribacteraceae bacterium]
MHFRLPLVVLCTVILAGCAQKQPAVPTAGSSSSSASDGNVGAACTSHEECKTPMKYLLRSNCPFDSACVDGLCAVVCPMPSEGGWKVPSSCGADADCDCRSFVARDLENCRCIGGACMAVMK